MKNALVKVKSHSVHHIPRLVLLEDGIEHHTLYYTCMTPSTRTVQNSTPIYGDNLHVSSRMTQSLQAVRVPPKTRHVQRSATFTIQCLDTEVDGTHKNLDHLGVACR